MHRKLRDYLRYSKLIGTDDDKESLKQYLGSFLWHFIEERLVHYPNAFKERDIFKINTAYICDVVIIYDVIQIADMPPVLHTKIFQSHDEAVVIFWYKTNGIQSRQQWNIYIMLLFLLILQQKMNSCLIHERIHCNVTLYNNLP